MHCELGRVGRLSVLVASAGALLGCNNGWGSLEDKVDPVCREAVRTMRGVASGTGGSKAENAVFAFLTATSEDSMVRDCTKTVAPSLKPCTEYKHGTDSAIQCAGRYVDPALKEFFMIRCLQAQGVKLKDGMTALEAKEAMAGAGVDQSVTFLCLSFNGNK